MNSNLIQTFTSNKNKGFLWNLMLEANLFKDINPSNTNIVKNSFENKIKKIVNLPETHVNLVMMNKMLMKEMMIDLDNLREYSINKPLNTEELSKNKQAVLSNAMNLHKQDFDNMINIKKPSDIDFSDKLDEPLGSEMDKLLSEAISKREKELNMIIQQQPDVNKANSWINENTQPTTQPTIQPTTRLKIDDNEKVAIDVEELKATKKVKFGNTELINDSNTNSSFLDLFKTKPQANEDDKFLNKLVEIQQDISDIKNTLQILLNSLQQNT